MKSRPRLVLPALAGCALVVAGSCSSAYYGALEKLGVHKRDLLVERVEDGREAQAEAKEQFQSALAAFQALTGFEGGELQDAYEELDAEYRESDQRAQDVRKRIDSIESVAADLFEEWDDEIDSMQNAELKRSSRELLADTRNRYRELARVMQKAASTMDPVLTALRDQVLFLKHNLNARAVAALEGERVKIEGEVAALVKQMEASIAEADAFLRSMQEQGG